MIKRAIIFTMSTLILLTLVCCKSQQVDSSYGSEIILGTVFDGSVTKSTLRPLSSDYKFRLYVFANGETDFSKLVASRVYRISDASGTPVLDKGELPLTLPVNTYDTYIVGPLMGIDADSTAVEIASVSGVNCHIGNDILSSYTPLTVVKGKNNLSPTPLSHRMSKVSFEIRRPSDAPYTELKVHTITAYSQPVVGTFELNSNGGSIVASSAPGDIYDLDIDFKDVSDSSVDMFYGEDYFLPQPSHKLKIGAGFSAVTTSIGEGQYEQSGLIDVALEEGKHNRFTTDLHISSTIKWRLGLIPWADHLFGVNSSISEGFLLDLVGIDSPITIEGAQYWRDRSGNGNHAKLVGDVKHNKDDYYYQTTSDLDQFLEIPSLGNLDNVVIELVCRSESGLRSSVFSSANSASISIPYDNNDIVFKWGPEATATGLNVAYMPGNADAMGGLSTWQFTRQSTASESLFKIYRNGVLLKSGSVPNQGTDLGITRLLAQNSSKIKLYAVRVFRKPMSEANLVINAESDQELYGGVYVPRVIVLPDKAPQTIPTAGGIYTVEVTSNCDLVPICNLSDVTITPKNIPVGVRIPVQINVPFIPINDPRDIQVAFTASAGGNTKTVTWTGYQFVAPVISIDKTGPGVTIPYDGGSYTVRVDSRGDWWSNGGITTTPSGGGAVQGQNVQINVPMNRTTSPTNVSVAFIGKINGEAREVYWRGTQDGIPASSIIPREAIVSGGWTTFPEGKVLHIARRGNMPGQASSSEATTIWSTVTGALSDAREWFGVGKNNFAWLSTGGPSYQYYPIGGSCRHLGEGWYVPSRDELHLILGFGVGSGALGNDYRFVQGETFWSSSCPPRQGNNDQAYVVNAGVRYALMRRSGTYKVRCVLEI